VPYEEAFYLAVKEKRYFYAYSLLKNYPQLQNTQAFLDMQKAYTTAFSQAKELLSAGKKGDAELLLEPFANIKEKRPYIELLLYHKEVRERFITAMEEQNYTEAYIMTKKLPLLRYLPLYDSLESAMEQLLQDTQRELFAMEFEAVQKRLKKLEDAAYKPQEIQKIKKRLHAAQKLQKLYEAGEFANCYELIDSNHLLSQEFLLVNLLQKHWEKLIKKAELLAQNGEFYELKELFGDLIFTESRQSVMRTLFCMSFWSKIEESLQKRDFDIVQKLLYTYLESFGYDTKVRELIMQYEERSREKLAIIYDYKEPTFSAWRDSVLFKPRS
jgi:hypothetical protein